MVEREDGHETREVRRAMGAEYPARSGPAPAHWSSATGRDHPGRPDHPGHLDRSPAAGRKAEPSQGRRVHTPTVHPTVHPGRLALQGRRGRQGRTSCRGGNGSDG